MTINGIQCIWVEAGTFMMGSPTTEVGRQSDETQHQVTLTKDYWIGKYPITQGQYKAVIETNPSHTSYGIGDNYPVNTVYWNEAVAFCNAVGGRLPTEAEWEYAARGGKQNNGYKIYSGSNDINTVAWYNGNSAGKSHPVGQKTPNELGIYDMSGGMGEWCNDWWGDYPSGSVVDPIGGTEGYNQVNRGDSYKNPISINHNCRVAHRSYDGNSYSDLGFRIVFNQYKITFNTNGGLAIANVVAPSSTKAARPSDPTKTGWTFLGWYKEAILSNAFDFNTPLNADITLYAKWNRNQYNIIYHLYDGTNNALNPTTYNVETPTITLGTPTKQHYDFKGWYANYKFTGASITSIPAGSTGDKTLYAKWEIRKYTVKFDAKKRNLCAAKSRIPEHRRLERK